MDDSSSPSTPLNPGSVPAPVSASDLHSLQSAISNAIKECPDGLFDEDHPNKKMKFSSNEEDEMAVDGEGGKTSGKVSHNAIEKRRRDKMNMYIDELAAMVPMCSVVSRRPDKLTILKMAVRHLKALRYANGGGHKNQLRPTFLTDEELKHLILEAEDGFLFIVSCENTRILYASNSVNHVLHHTKEDLCELGFLDIVHPCDQELVKEQLLVTESDLPAGEKKSTAADFNMISGSRRSFFCRMRHGKRAPDGQDGEKKKGQSVYTIVHVTGYLKNWDADTFSMSHDFKYNADESEEELADFTCLVAVGRILQVPLKSQKQPNEFNWRLTMDDKFLFVDPRTTAVLEYLPHELIGQSIYKFYHPSDLATLTDAHQKVTSTHCEVTYRFRAKSGRWVWLHGYFLGFNNPFSGQLQYIICNNIARPDTTVSDEHKTDFPDQAESAKLVVNKPKMSVDMGQIMASTQLMTSQTAPSTPQMLTSHPCDTIRTMPQVELLSGLPPPTHEILQYPQQQQQGLVRLQDPSRPTHIVTPNVELAALPGDLDQMTRIEIEQNTYNIQQHNRFGRQQQQQGYTVQQPQHVDQQFAGEIHNINNNRPYILQDKFQHHQQPPTPQQHPGHSLQHTGHAAQQHIQEQHTQQQHAQQQHSQQQHSQQQHSQQQHSQQQQLLPQLVQHSTQQHQQHSTQQQQHIDQLAQLKSDQKRSSIPQQQQNTIPNSVATSSSILNSGLGTAQQLQQPQHHTAAQHHPSAAAQHHPGAVAQHHPGTAVQHHPGTAVQHQHPNMTVGQHPNMTVQLPQHHGTAATHHGTAATHHGTPATHHGATVQQLQQPPQQHFLPSLNGVHNIRTKEQFEQARLYNEQERLLLQEYEQFLNKQNGIMN